MPIRIYRRGKVWHYRGTVAGRRVRGSCKTSDQAIAARQAAEIERREWQCHHDGPQSVLTFAKAALLYRAAGKSSRFLAPVEDYWKDTLVKDITPSAIREMAIKLYPRCSGSTRNRLGIVPVQAVINHAAESELCSPIKVKRFKFDAKIKKPATLEWVNAFRAHATPHLGTMTLFMFLTGARPGEAIGLRWKDVNLQRATAVIRETKIRGEREAHLPAVLVAALANLPRVEGRGVFVYMTVPAIFKAWYGAIEDAGIEPMSPHSCRHGFATGLLRKKIDVVTVAKLGGWKDATQVLRTYGHALNEPTLTEALVGTDLTQVVPASTKKMRKTTA